MHTETDTISYSELTELITLIKNVHGFDFSDYSAASLKRRVTRIIQLQKLTLFDLRTLLTNDPDYFESFLIEVTVNVTEIPSFTNLYQKTSFPISGPTNALKCGTQVVLPGKNSIPLPSCSQKKTSMKDVSFMEQTSM